MAHHGEQLKQAVKDYKSGATGFARAMGISRQWVYGYFGKPVLPLDVRVKAASVLSMPVDTLFTPVKAGFDNDTTIIPATGDPFTTKSGNQMEDLGNGLYRLHTLLVDQKSAAGYLTGWGDQEYLGELKRHTITVRKPALGLYRSFQINDNNESMWNPNSERSIRPGDIVTARLLQRSLWKDNLHIKDWPTWVIIHKTEGITTKDIIDYNRESGIIMCRSLNPDKDAYPDFPLFIDDIIQLGNVVKVERDYNY